MLVLPTFAFFWMMAADSRRSRGTYCLFFTLYRCVLFGLFLYKIYKDVFDEPILDEQMAVRNRCNTYRENGGLAAAGFEDFQDCYNKTILLMTMVNIIALAVYNLISFHFITVVHTHYRNADLAEELGGVAKRPGDLTTSSERGIEVAENSGVSTTDISIEHAIDNQDTETTYP